MKQPASGPDPVVDSDRNAGSTPPESGQEGNNVVGRPTVDKDESAFHMPTETADLDAEPFNEKEALLEGGSFDSIGRLQDVDGE